MATRMPRSRLSPAATRGRPRGNTPTPRFWRTAPSSHCQHRLARHPRGQSEAADYQQDFAAFKAALQTQPIEQKDGALHFATLTFYGPAKVGEIKGKPLNLAPAWGYDSPFIRSTWNSGLHPHSQKGSGDGRTRLPRATEPKKTLGVPDHPGVPAGVGGDEPLVFVSQARAVMTTVGDLRVYVTGEPMRFINGPIPREPNLRPRRGELDRAAQAGFTPFVVVAMLGTVPLLPHGDASSFTPHRSWCACTSGSSRGVSPCFLLVVAGAGSGYIDGSSTRSRVWMWPARRTLLVGLWLQRGIPYVLCDEPLPRRRVLFMLAAPLCPAMPASQAPHDALVIRTSRFCVFFFSLHAALCVGDAATFLRCRAAGLVDARIHNQGWDTYWSNSRDTNVGQPAGLTAST